MTTPDIRVEKGHAEPEEVAAITAILLARAATHPEPAPTHHRAAWHHPDQERPFRSPHSWR